MALPFLYPKFLLLIAYTEVVITPTKSKYQDANFFVIFGFYHNFEG